MMVPFAAKIIPMFRMFSKMGLLNNYLAIILPAIGSPFLIFFFKQNAYSFPKDTLEAARMDGLNEYQIFFKIFYANDEVHICSSRNIHVHGKLEQLHVASDRTAE